MWMDYNYARFGNGGCWVCTCFVGSTYKSFNAQQIKDNLTLPNYLVHLKIAESGAYWVMINQWIRHWYN